ncbi:MAG: type I DNA topoisomerase [Candidatus Aureabacteria bacterium]|nr:type I DNA topoisomerase [Candidatus Auribacterota bacterium]
MKLVIVESPTKAKTINKYLGQDYEVKSSFGHIRDLPVKAVKKKPGVKKTSLDIMGVDPANNWQARYEIPPGKTKVVKELKEFANKAETIYLAADPDREGEAIAWHLAELLGKNRLYHRVTYQEITKKAIRDAFDHPGTINMDRVNAQQARRFLDRVVGFQISPLLWRHIAKGLSAGRVQSVAVRLIVEREREIKAFIPVEYWDVLASLYQTDEKDCFNAEVIRYKDKKLTLNNRQEAENVKNALLNQTFTVAEKTDKSTRSKPWPPFVTSTLQQAASVRLGYGVSRTMMLAQRLYESGYITYMRTDSTKLSADAVSSIRDYIRSSFGKPYLPENERLYISGALAQEAHEAIRPSDISTTAEALTLDPDAKKLYDLIWRQTVACQMNDAEFDTTQLTIKSIDYELQAKGRTMKFDGWQKVMPEKNKEETILPPLNEGDALHLKEIFCNQHFTKPPPRYSEASLVKELEKKGIGRPSTYASIISTIQDRGYAHLESKRFYAEKIGEIVTDQLMQGFSDLMDYQFTAKMEEELDKIATADLQWKKVLDQFYEKFRKNLERFEQKSVSTNEPIPTPIPCNKCGRPMVIRFGQTGSFLGCTGYSLPREQRCDFTRNLMKADGFINVKEGEEELGNPEELLKKKRCPVCGTAMDEWLVDEQTKVHLCGNAPKCKGVEIEKGEFQLKSLGAESQNILCDKCGKPMQLREGRFGKYMACSNTPQCKNTRKILKSGKIAPPKCAPVPLKEVRCSKCSSPMLIRDGASGLFIACSAFPKCRSSENVPVSILKKYESQLPDKYKHLAKAPDICPSCGAKVILRWNRKGQSNYFSCENGMSKKCKWVQQLGN